ncbi:FY [Hepatospora eriocheir]|uniref:Polyadenylation factor subunit 2 n=1 Tax=Hepatospora eriocheir TaxID=1081669 RepID=A0A1X0QIF3_9MICR|nr:FY [Hepatospora eriocheir]
MINPADQRKIIYDGKRVQPIYERRMVDYTSALIYEEYNKPTIPYSYDSDYLKDFDCTPQVITIPPINKLSLERNRVRNYPIQFMQMCINKQRSPVNSIVWTPDGRRLLSGSNSGEITMWNGLFFNFDTILQGHNFPIRKLLFSRNNNLLISGDSKGSVKYWNTAMSNLNAIENVHSEGIKDMSFSWNDNNFLTASDDATIKIIDTNTCKVLNTLKGHNWDIRKAQYHDMYSLIVSGGKDNLLKFWDPRASSSAIRTFHYHKNTILALDMTRNYLITGGKDQVIKQLDFRTMKECFTYKTDADITCLRFLQKEEEFAFASGNGIGEIVYWENFDDSPVAKTLESHENIIWCLEEHPAGHLLASASADFQIKFWGRLKPSHKIKEVEEEEEDFTAIPGL